MAPLRTIRPAVLADAPEISALITGVSRFFTLEPDGRGAGAFLKSITTEAIAGYIGDPGYHYITAFEENTLAGVAALRGGNHLFHLFVAPAFHRQGLARDLWEEIKKSAAPGTSEITVNSSPYAVPVYERFGFAVAGPRTEAAGIAFIPMKKRI